MPTTPLVQGDDQIDLVFARLLRKNIPTPLAINSAGKMNGNHAVEAVRDEANGRSRKQPV